MRDADNEDLVTSSEAARILNCVPDNVRLLARTGKLPTAMVVGRNQRLFRRQKVKDLAEARAAKVASE